MIKRIESTSRDQLPEETASIIENARMGRIPVENIKVAAQIGNPEAITYLGKEALKNEECYEIDNPTILEKIDHQKFLIGVLNYIEDLIKLNPESQMAHEQDILKKIRSSINSEIPPEEKGLIHDELISWFKMQKPMEWNAYAIEALYHLHDALSANPQSFESEEAFEKNKKLQFNALVGQLMQAQQDADPILRKQKNAVIETVQTKMSKYIGNEYLKPEEGDMRGIEQTSYSMVQRIKNLTEGDR